MLGVAIAVALIGFILKAGAALGSGWFLVPLAGVACVCHVVVHVRGGRAAAHPARGTVQRLSVRGAAAPDGVHARLQLRRGHAVERQLETGIGIGRRLHHARRGAGRHRRPAALHSCRGDLGAARQQSRNTKRSIEFAVFARFRALPGLGKCGRCDGSARAASSTSDAPRSSLDTARYRWRDRALSSTRGGSHGAPERSAGVVAGRQARHQ